jgi:hypothetical protein
VVLPNRRSRTYAKCAELLLEAEGIESWKDAVVIRSVEPPGIKCNACGITFNSHLHICIISAKFDDLALANPRFTSASRARFLAKPGQKGVPSF